MIVWMNWKTKVTHLSEDCHQIARILKTSDFIEVQEGTPEEITDIARRYCGWCVARYLRAGARVNLLPDPDLRAPAERADYITPEELARRASRLDEAEKDTAFIYPPAS